MFSSFATRACVRRLRLSSVSSISSHGPLHRTNERIGLVRLLEQQRVLSRLSSTQAAAPATDSVNVVHKPIAAKVKRNTSRNKKKKNATSSIAVKLVENGENGATTAIATKKKKKKKRTLNTKEVEEEMLTKAMQGEEFTAAAVGVAEKADTEKKQKNQKEKTAPLPHASVVAPATPAVVAEVSPSPAVVQTKEPVPLKNPKVERITMTLQEIASLQKTLPSEREIASLITKLRQKSFENAHTLFDLYRNYGNPYLDENFLTPGVLACCEAQKPAEGIHIVRDMLNQGRNVDESTLRTLFDACDQASAAVEAIELWELMVAAGMKVEKADLNRFLDICYRQEYVDGAVKVLKELRLVRSISVHTYMHWLLRASIVWRSDAFFDILMEMRLSGVEPEISSLTSLESGRKDRALTVMEGVRAVGLDPCFSMSSVFSSMQSSVYQNGPNYLALSKKDIKAAKAKFGDLTPINLDWPVTPIPQVLETQAAGLILQQETFRRLKRTQVNHIDGLLQMLPITANMTLNLRKQLLRMSLLVNTHRVRRDKKKITEEYDSGRSLIELSNVHNYPPVSLMRVILRNKGKSQLEIKNALSNPMDRLSKRDQRELRRATEYDSIHKSDPFIGSPTYNADSLERAIEHFLKAKGIRLKTQEELCADQITKHGRRVISPDILLLDPVVINGVPIRWIDAKNYYGAHIVSKRLISTQLANYVKEWGPGAIVFGMGYSDMFSLPGVICLDTTPFPKTRKETAKVRVKSFLQSCRNVFRWKRHLGSDLTQQYPGINDDAPKDKEVA